MTKYSKYHADNTLYHSTNVCIYLPMDINDKTFINSQNSLNSFMINLIIILNGSIYFLSIAHSHS